MAWAELFRPDYKIADFPQIRSNVDLLEKIKGYAVDRVYLFRAGLIINKKVIEAGPEILNIHCARVPDYGGLGSIMRALEAEAYEQEATLHRVVERIDEGEVIATLPYNLDKALTYRQNEEIAYDAGIRLLLDQLKISSKNG
jgi:methionyl-tRNA formyltransferase